MLNRELRSLFVNEEDQDEAREDARTDQGIRNRLLTNSRPAGTVAQRALQLPDQSLTRLEFLRGLDPQWRTEEHKRELRQLLLQQKEDQRLILKREKTIKEKRRAAAKVREAKGGRTPSHKKKVNPRSRQLKAHRKELEKLEVSDSEVDAHIPADTEEGGPADRQRAQARAIVSTRPARVAAPGEGLDPSSEETSSEEEKREEEEEEEEE